MFFFFFFCFNANFGDRFEISEDFSSSSLLSYLVFFRIFFFFFDIKELFFFLYLGSDELWYFVPTNWFR